MIFLAQNEVAKIKLIFFGQNQLYCRNWSQSSFFGPAEVVEVKPVIS
jgi:hypothetical protein